MHLKEFILSTLLVGLVKALFAKWAFSKGVSFIDWVLDKYFIRHARAWAIRQHYKKKKKGQGHQYPNPFICPEEDCQLF